MFYKKKNGRNRKDEHLSIKKAIRGLSDGFWKGVISKNLFYTQ